MEHQFSFKTSINFINLTKREKLVSSGLYKSIIESNQRFLILILRIFSRSLKTINQIVT